MTCESTKRKLKAWIDGEAGARTAAAIERHLQGCSGCREVASQLREIGQALRRAKDPLPALPARPDLLWEEAVAARRQEERTVHFLQRYAAAAAAVLVLGGALALSPLVGPPGQGLAEAPVEERQDEALAAFFQNLEPVGTLSGAAEEF